MVDRLQHRIRGKTGKPYRWLSLLVLLGIFCLAGCSTGRIRTRLTDDAVRRTVKLSDGILYFEPYELGGLMPLQPPQESEAVTRSYEDIVAETGFDLVAATEHLPEKLRLSELLWSEDYWIVPDTGDRVYGYSEQTKDYYVDEWHGMRFSEGTVWGGYYGSTGNPEWPLSDLCIHIQREGEYINHESAYQMIRLTASWLPPETSNIGDAKVGIYAQDGYEKGLFAKDPPPIAQYILRVHHTERMDRPDRYAELLHPAGAYRTDARHLRRHGSG